MGKKSKSSYTNTAVRINGQTKASTYKKGKTVYTDYNMSPDEKAAYDYAQKSFADNIKNVNVFSSATQNQINDKLLAYKNKGVDTINSVYTPMIENLKSDIASRFGNFDNSSFLKDLKSIESSRSGAVSSLAQDLLIKEDELVNNELSRRYNYLSFLNGVINQPMNNMSNYSSIMSSSRGGVTNSNNSSFDNLGTYIQMGKQILSTFMS